MEVSDSAGEPLGDRSGVHPGHARVSGIQGQLQLLARAGEHPVDLLFGLHHGAHVMVVDRDEALVGDMAGNLGERGREPRPLRFRQDRSGGERRGRITVNRVHRLGQDAHRAAHLAQQAEMRRQRCFLGFHAAPEQSERVPARDELETMRCESRAQGLRLRRHPAPLLDSLETDLARLPQALLERDVLSQRRIVVVGPPDGIDAVADHRSQSPARCRASASS